MKQDDDKLLEVFLATSGYTIRALEEAIDDLKKAIRNSRSRDLIPIFQERLEELEEYLLTITKLGQE